MLLPKNNPSALLALVVVASLINLAMVATGLAEPPGSLQTKSESLKPLARIGKESTGFAVNCFALAPRGDLVAVGSHDGNIRFWSLAESKVIRTLDATKNGYIG